MALTISRVMTLSFASQVKGRNYGTQLRGEMLAAPSPRVLEDGRLQLHIELPPFGSTIVAFTNDTKTHLLQTSPICREIPFKTLRPWEITFQQGRGGPKDPVSLTELKDWTTFNDPAVHFFSGTATYRTSVLAPDLPPEKRLWLSFGDVREIARVKVNGVSAGTVWAKPLVLRVDPFLKPGENLIEIEVTNLWSNRIIGDLQPGVTKRITATNITKYKPDSPLLPSGLLGPIEWLVEP